MKSNTFRTAGSELCCPRPLGGGGRRAFKLFANVTTQSIDVRHQKHFKAIACTVLTGCFVEISRCSFFIYLSYWVSFCATDANTPSIFFTRRGLVTCYIILLEVVLSRLFNYSFFKHKYLMVPTNVERQKTRLERAIRVSHLSV